jgi:Ca2+-transporting ATPase
MPFLPLQTLFVNFTVQVFLAVGLGYGKAREGLMGDAPRSPETPILPARLMVWLVFGGLVMTVISLGIIAWATPLYGDSVARTMGLTAFSFANIWFAFETSDEEHTMFGSALLANPTLLKMGALGIVATVLMSELQILNRILDTVNMTIEQWVVCFVVSLLIIVVAEIKKLLKIRTTELPRLAAPKPEAGAAAG